MNGESPRPTDRAHAPAVAVGLAALLSACAVGPDPRPVDLQTPAAFVRAEAAGPHSDAAEWLQVLGDPTLDALVERALESNLDLEQAAARTATARAAARFIRNDLLPTSQGRASFERRRISEATAGIGAFAGGDGGSSFENPANTFDVGFDASWELDFFGGKRRAAGAARDDYGAAVAEEAATRLTITAEVARTYAELRLAERLLDLSESAIEAQREISRLAEVRVRVGESTPLDREQANARLAALQADEPRLDIDRVTALNQLAVLLGEPPGALDAMVASPTLPRMPDAFELGAPADLLRRRPDVIAAELRAAAATQRIGVEIAEYFPRVEVLGSIGTQSVAASDLFTGAARTFSIGPSVTWRILDFARIDAAVDAAQGRERETLAAYRQTALRALEEVETEAARFSRLGDERALRVRAVEATERALRTVTIQYKQGAIDLLQVLDAERALLDERQAHARAETDLVIAYASLVKALGGGARSDGADGHGGSDERLGES